MSFLPIWIVDVVGSILMIVFSLLCIRLTLLLKRRDPENVVWTYLLWVCYGLTCFAVSRSAGHLLKQLLHMKGFEDIWLTVQPYSGAINTLMFVVVAAITLFFQRTWTIYQGIVRDQNALHKTHHELLYLNRNLEELVQERTQELTVSEKKYRRIFEASRDMILVTGTDGKILDLNPAGREMLKCCQRETDILNRYFASFFSDDTQWKRLLNEIESMGFVMSVEADLKRLDGAIMKSLISAGLSRGAIPGEDTIHFLVKDIEQRRLMEQQMAQADKLASIGELSSGIAHEINNPLGIILGYTQLLRRNESPNTERHNDLVTIEKHVRSCKTIVEDLLNFARSSPPKKEFTDLHAIIDDVIAFIHQHAGADHVEIIRDYSPDIPPALVDKEKIRQVLINLIMNARYAVGEQGNITLATGLDVQGDHIVLTVSDTGHGIDPDDISRIFDPFFTTKPTGEGTGLGLSVSYGIIKNHGGEIAVDSTPEKGTVFRVLLPVVSENHRISE
ncbi:MAG: PAS domain S-box protein [Desulfobacteraceae bacterium]|nr:PAS domain S-box protein [Desulfobacteraceae bacterium]